MVMVKSSERELLETMEMALSALVVEELRTVSFRKIVPPAHEQVAVIGRHCLFHRISAGFCEAILPSTTAT
jgi:hypothetical protein